MDYQQSLNSSRRSSLINQGFEFVHLYEQMTAKMKQLERVEMEASIKKENHLLKTYHRVFEKIKNELLEAKKSYESVDKQSMIDDRLLKYASDIKFYRQDCSHLQKKLNHINSHIEEIAMENKGIEQENEAMRICLRKYQTQKAQTVLKRYQTDKTIKQPDKTSFSLTKAKIVIRSKNQITVNEQNNDIQQTPSKRLSVTNGESAGRTNPRFSTQFIRVPYSNYRRHKNHPLSRNI